jgi:hypothetical protein
VAVILTSCICFQICKSLMPKCRITSLLLLGSFDQLTWNPMACPTYYHSFYSKEFLLLYTVFYDNCLSRYGYSVIAVKSCVATHSRCNVICSKLRWLATAAKWSHSHSNHVDFRHGCYEVEALYILKEWICFPCYRGWYNNIL